MEQQQPIFNNTEADKVLKAVKKDYSTAYSIAAFFITNDITKAFFFYQNIKTFYIFLKCFRDVLLRKKKSHLPKIIEFSKNCYTNSIKCLSIVGTYLKILPSSPQNSETEIPLESINIVPGNTQNEEKTQFLETSL